VVLDSRASDSSPGRPGPNPSSQPPPIGRREPLPAASSYPPLLRSWTRPRYYNSHNAECTVRKTTRMCRLYTAFDFPRVLNCSLCSLQRWLCYQQPPLVTGTATLLLCPGCCPLSRDQDRYPLDSRPTSRSLLCCTRWWVSTSCPSDSSAKIRYNTHTPEGRHCITFETRATLSRSPLFSFTQFAYILFVSDLASF